MGISKPNVDPAYSAKQGKVGFLGDGKDDFAFFGLRRVNVEGYPKNAGIEFSATVNNPDGWTSKVGKWEFVQLTTPDRYVTMRSTGKNKHISQNGKTVLDGKVPYGTKGPTKQDGAAGPFDTGTHGTAMDMPGFFTKDFSMCKCGENQKYRMYIMYQPPGANPAWVPVQFIEWKWQGMATLTNGEWIGKDWAPSKGGPTNPTSTDTTVHPIWKEAYKAQLVND
jgi:hypothetical protein